MPALFLLAAALAGAQMTDEGHRAHLAPMSQNPGLDTGRGRRAFISPMGEPFRVPGGDGLTAWFQQADRNHDGSVTLDELKLDAQRFFEALDLNHDHQIDPDEIDHYENVVAPEVRTGSYFTGGMNMDDEASGGGRLGLLTIPEPVTAADTNLDRGISEQEFQTAAAKRFASLDSNNDGRLTLPELQAAQSAVRSNARRSRRAPGDTPLTPYTSDQPDPSDEHMPH
jgi:Ca2+-binding EF-hand superfamily protein